MLPSSSFFNRASSPGRQTPVQLPTLVVPEDSRPTATVLVHEDDLVTQKIVVKRFEKQAAKQGLNLRILTADSYEGSIDALKKSVIEDGEKIDGLFTDNQTKSADGGMRENAGLDLLTWVGENDNARYAPFLRVMNSSDPVGEKATKGWLAQKFHSKKEQKTLDLLISNMVKNLKSLKRHEEAAQEDNTSTLPSRPSSAGGLSAHSRSNSEFFEEGFSPSLLKRRGSTNLSRRQSSVNLSREQSLANLSRENSGLWMGKNRASVSQPPDEQ